MEWKEWIGKRIFVRLKTGKVYSGTVEDVDTNASVVFISIKDKFGLAVTFTASEITELKEEGEK